MSPCFQALSGHPRKMTVQDRQDLAHAVQIWLSPTFNLVHAIDNGRHEGNTNTLSIDEWRMMSEENFDDSVLLNPDLEYDKSEIFRFAFGQITATLQLPSDRSFLNRVGGLFFGRRPNVFYSLNKISSAIYRDLWKNRPPGDLRSANPEFFAEIPDQEKYSKTFRFLIERVMSQFDAQQFRWPITWIEWGRAVSQFLEHNFPNADVEERVYIVTALEHFYLQLPPLPSEEHLLNFAARLSNRKLRPAEKVALDAFAIGSRGVTRIRSKAQPVASAAETVSIDVSSHSITYSLSLTAQKDIENLQTNLKQRFDRFIEILTAGHLELLRGGSWQYEKIRQFGDNAYSVRLNRGYRILFHWNDERHITISNVDKQTIHGN